MHILLCAATEFEIASAQQYFEENALKDHQLEFLITGVGMLPATYSLSKYLSNHKPDLIIQAGIGGALNTSTPLGTTFAILSDCIADLGVEENGSFKTLFDLKLAEGNRLPWNNGKLVNPSFLLLAMTSLSLAEGITVNEISTNEQRISYYREKWDAQVESLEGAALHYVALQEQTAFLQIRTISNYIGERDKSKWILEEAIAALNKEIIRILPTIEAKNLSTVGGQIL